VLKVPLSSNQPFIVDLFLSGKQHNENRASDYDDENDLFL